MNLYSKTGWLNSAIFVSQQNITDVALTRWWSSHRNSPSETFCAPPVSGNRRHEVSESPSPSSITSGLNSFGIFLSGFFPKSLRKGLLKADLNIKQMQVCHILTLLQEKAHNATVRNNLYCGYLVCSTCIKTGQHERQCESTFGLYTYQSTTLNIHRDNKSNLQDTISGSGSPWAAECQKLGSWPGEKQYTSTVFLSFSLAISFLSQDDSTLHRPLIRASAWFLKSKRTKSMCYARHRICSSAGSNITRVKHKDQNNQQHNRSHSWDRHKSFQSCMLSRCPIQKPRGYQGSFSHFIKPEPPVTQRIHTWHLFAGLLAAWKQLYQR